MVRLARLRSPSSASAAARRFDHAGCRLAPSATEGEAATALTERWGFPITVGEPALRERYDRQSIEVNDGNVTVLSAQLVDPVPIGNSDLLYTAGMHVANVERDGETKPWLVQVDP